MRSIAALSVLFLGMASADFYNNVPIPGIRPQFTMGTAKQGIDIHIVYDLMCSDSAALHPKFQQFLNMTWNVTNTTVQDAVQVSYTFLPLPYHHEVWVSHKLVPYFLDNCNYGSKCQFMDYMNYCFVNQDMILGAKNMSENAIILQWTNKVAQDMNLTQADLLAVYNDAYDTHNTEMRVREMYKWNTHHHVSGTPFGFVNGVLLETYPETADEWMNVLFGVYQNQYKP